MQNLNATVECPICKHAIQDGDEICPCCLINLRTGMPTEPSLKRRAWQLAITVPFFVFGLVSLIVLGKQALAPCAVLMAISGFFLHASIEGHMEDIRLYKLAQTDHNKFIEESLDRWSKIKSSTTGRGLVDDPRAPGCPVCHSASRVRRYTYGYRRTSTETSEAPLSPGDKKWKCDRCRYTFNVDELFPWFQPDQTEELRKYEAP